MAANGAAMAPNQDTAHDLQGDRSYFRYPLN